MVEIYSFEEVNKLRAEKKKEAIRDEAKLQALRAWADFAKIRGPERKEIVQAGISAAKTFVENGGEL